MKKFYIKIFLGLFVFSSLIAVKNIYAATCYGETGCEAWYKADALSLTDGDPVGTWTDSSGNSRDLLQTTAGLKPLFETNEVNTTLPAVLFDGVDDEIQKTSVSISQPLQVFTVVKTTSATPAFGYIWSGSGIGNYVLSDPQFCLYAGASICKNPISTPNSWHIYSEKYDGASSVLYQDGTSVVTGDVSTAGMSNIRLGSSGGAQYFDGEIAEQLYFSGVDAGTRVNIEDCLHQKYGITVSTSGTCVDLGGGGTGGGTATTATSTLIAGEEQFQVVILIIVATVLSLMLLRLIFASNDSI